MSMDIDTRRGFLRTALGLSGLYGLTYLLSRSGVSVPASNASTPRKINNELNDFEKLVLKYIKDTSGNLDFQHSRFLLGFPPPYQGVAVAMKDKNNPIEIRFFAYMSFEIPSGYPKELYDDQIPLSTISIPVSGLKKINVAPKSNDDFDKWFASQDFGDLLKQIMSNKFKDGKGIADLPLSTTITYANSLTDLKVGTRVIRKNIGGSKLPVEPRPTRSNRPT